jgi:hypothetical protein
MGCIYSTPYVGMIVRRIWNARDVARNFMETGNGTQSTNMTPRLNSVIRIIIDSALGYTLVSFTLFVSQVARSNALYITSGAVSLLWLIMYTRKDANTGGFKGDPSRRNRIQSY